MIHAYNPAGQARCGAPARRGEVVTQALYRDLCRRCIADVTALCRRLTGGAS